MAWNLSRGTFTYSHLEKAPNYSGRVLLRYAECRKDKNIHQSLDERAQDPANRRDGSRALGTRIVERFFYRRYRTEGLEILAVSLDKGSSDKVQTFADEYRLSFPVLLDSDGQVESRYHTLTIPTTFVIDKKGMVVAEVEGAKNWESKETLEAVEYLLKAPG